MQSTNIFLKTKRQPNRFNVIKILIYDAYSRDGFSVSSRRMGLNVLWPKTKVQSMGADFQLTDVLVAGQKVEAVEFFCYLGSVQSSSGRCKPETLLG